jgi:hypothetical protein
MREQTAITSADAKFDFTKGSPECQLVRLKPKRTISLVLDGFDCARFFSIVLDSWCFQQSAWFNVKRIALQQNPTVRAVARPAVSVRVTQRWLLNESKPSIWNRLSGCVNPIAARERQEHRNVGA